VPYIRINKDTCKGCELCLTACPRNLIIMSKDLNRRGVHFAVYKETGKCTGCTLCALMCPDVCIEVFKDWKGKKEE
jgi:2-oxoglutarate ferredoxin oxidoreductase subunit delta